MNSRMRLVPHSGSLGSVYEVYYELESYTVCVIAHTVYPSLASQFAERWSALKPHPRVLSQATAFPKGSARMHFASAKDSLLSPPPSLYFLLTLLLFSSRREFIGTTRDDVKLPFHARKRISHIISAPRGLFYPFLGLKETRRSYRRDNLRAAIRDTPTQAPKSSGGCVNQPWVLSYR